MAHTLTLTGIELRVSDLAESIDFYTRRLGFSLARRSDREAELATNESAATILTLIEEKEARHPPRDAAGLFHAALLFPNRPALGGWLQFAAEKGVDFEGFSDHGVSEAIYLSDPDGNGLEFYADRPRAQWPHANGELAMITRPLDVRSLFTAATPPGDTPLDGASWGHLHLRVTDLEQSQAFYIEKLGLQVTQHSYPGARFLAADGYHHHLGLNIWGAPRLPQPPGALGLAAAFFARAGVATESTAADPDGIRLCLRPASAAA